MSCLISRQKNTTSTTSKREDLKSKNIRDKIIHIIYAIHTFWVVEGYQGLSRLSPESEGTHARQEEEGENMSKGGRNRVLLQSSLGSAM